MDHAGPVRRPERIRDGGLAAVWEDGGGPGARLQPAEESVVAVHGLSAEGCSGRAALQRECARRRSGGYCDGALCDPRARAAGGKPDHAPDAGMHGFDPRKMPEMKASFFAAGPDIVHGKTVRRLRM